MRIRHAVLGLAPLVGLLVASPAHADIENGAAVYDRQCSQCHGIEGDADGPAANFMLPRPRVFKDNSSYKFRTTPSGALPTEQDMFDIITRGIPGTSMPDFAFLEEQARWDLVEFLRSLSEDFSDEDYLEDMIVLEELQNVEPPASSPESIEQGRQMYLEAKCDQCHGDQGRGNGVSFNDLKDNWGNAILPANLTAPETFRGGAEPVDIFRTFTTGLDGTPMPSYKDSPPLDNIENRWHLVNYMISLFPENKEQPDEKVVANWVEQLPTTADDEAWNLAPTARFKMMPNIIESPRVFWATIEYVSVQAFYSDNEVVLRIQWDDRSNSTGTNANHEYKDRDTTIYTDTDHPDQFAVQLPTKLDDKARPYFLFGDKKRSVNLWWWRADSNETIAKLGSGDTINDSDGTPVTAEVTYDDGRYTMLVRRGLTTSNADADIQMAPGNFVPIAFHAWDGFRGEVGRRRSLTTWYWLHLVPTVPQSAYITPPIAFGITLLLLLGLVRVTRRRVEERGRLDKDD